MSNATDNWNSLAAKQKLLYSIVRSSTGRPDKDFTALVQSISLPECPDKAFLSTSPSAEYAKLVIFCYVALNLHIYGMEFIHYHITVAVLSNYLVIILLCLHKMYVFEA